MPPAFRNSCGLDYPSLDKIFPSSYVASEIHTVNKILFTDRNHCYLLSD